MKTDNSESGLKTLKAAMSLLELFTTEKQKWGLSEMQRHAGMPKANVYRILHTLQLLGYLNQDKNTGKYYLSSKLYIIGSSSRTVNGVLSKGSEYLYKLYSSVNSTTTLNVPDGLDIIHTDVLPGMEGIVTYSGKQSRTRAYLAASGLAILAASDESRISLFKNHVFERPTENSIKNYEEMLKELDRVRVRKYSINNELRREGVFAIAMPIIGMGNIVVGSFSVSCFTSKVNEEYVKHTIDSIREAARGLSYELGFDPSNGINNAWFAI